MMDITKTWYNLDMKLDTAATSSKYLAMADTLKREILSGKYETRERFPSEGMLVRRFGVSRPTVERALRELKREGLLESRSGSGSYLTFAALNATGSIGVIAPDYRKIEFFTNLCDAIASEARASGKKMSILRACRAVWRDVNGGYPSPEALYDYCHSHKDSF